MWHSSPLSGARANKGGSRSVEDHTHVTVINLNELADVTAAGPYSESLNGQLALNSPRSTRALEGQSAVDKEELCIKTDDLIVAELQNN